MKLIHTIIASVACAVMLGLLASCGGAKLSVANEQYDRGEYFEAQKTYRKVYNKLTKREERPQRGVVAYKMGLCYEKLGMSARASSAFANAIRYNYPDSTAILKMAKSLQAEGKYAAAVKAYEDYLKLDPKSDTAQIGLSGCKWAMERKATPTRYIVRQSKLLNSRRADYAPMFIDPSAADVLYFTTTNEKVTGDKKSEITGMKKGDIWMSKKNEKGEWQRPEALEGELNTEMDEGVCSFTPDGQTMYLTRARREPNASTSVEIFTSQRSDAKWSAPVKYEILNDTVSAVGHPSVSADGKWLYFTSDMPGGQGGRDIWRINLLDKQGSLENMGEFINTPGDEMFPYSRTDSILYFASDGHPGFGGLDIFKATLTPSGGWKVENMGSPVNSAADDFGITFGQGESGFLTSNRGDGRGYDHIYSFVLPDLEIWISGWVLDRDEEPVPNAVIRIIGKDGSNQKAVANPDGSFRFPLQRGVDYVMLAGAKGYLNAKQEFTTDIAEEDAEYNVDFILASINKPVVIDNIFYDFDKAVLRDESKAALDEMAQIMRDNPNITIEMASHTDRVGSDEYNIGLSQRRAKSVIDYLISVGIKADRLQWQGYGKSRPKTITKKLARLYPQFKEGDVLTPEYIENLSEEDAEAADQINRRTEFQVLSIDYEMY
ncbi:MAG: OmpA family protein [Muribaculaceae bacterium]|nr:OmpA family protein [Muribaculaceae bacterium]